MAPCGGVGLMQLTVRHVEEVVHYDGGRGTLEVVDSGVRGLHLLVVVDFVNEDRGHLCDVSASVS